MRYHKESVSFIYKKIILEIKKVKKSSQIYEKIHKEKQIKEESQS